MSTLSDELATYLGEALEHSELTRDLGNFLTTCFSKSVESEDVSECVYDAIETTCGIRTSIKGFLSSQFMINCMSLANIAKNLAMSQKLSPVAGNDASINDVQADKNSKAEARFI